MVRNQVCQNIGVCVDIHVIEYSCEINFSKCLLIFINAYICNSTGHHKRCIVVRLDSDGKSVLHKGKVFIRCLDSDGSFTVLILLIVESQASAVEGSGNQGCIVIIDNRERQVVSGCIDVRIVKGCGQIDLRVGCIFGHFHIHCLHAIDHNGLIVDCCYGNRNSCLVAVDVAVPGCIRETVGAEEIWSGRIGQGVILVDYNRSMTPMCDAIHDQGIAVNVLVVGQHIDGVGRIFGCNNVVIRCHGRIIDRLDSNRYRCHIAVKLIVIGFECKVVRTFIIWVGCIRKVRCRAGERSIARWIDHRINQ